MELIALSVATGNASWAQLGERVIEAVDAAHPPSRENGENGLLPIYVSLNDASASGPVTIGAMADSYYEYLLKVWILKGKVKGERYRRMWER
jgi:mannosyl-oligosaccharide alpha-1,2-mannosidase